MQAAIAQGSSQPDTTGHLHGLTPEQQAQLRAIIAKDPQLLARLNGEADRGFLSGFAIAEPGSKNLVGIYDPPTIILPANSFDTSNAHLAATLRVQDMCIKFSRATDPAINRQVQYQVVENLQTVLNGSPALAGQLRRAVTPPAPGQRAALEQFAPLSGTVAGGTYDGNTRTISLPLTSLRHLGEGANFSERDMTFVLGHELQHSANYPRMLAAARTFTQEAGNIAYNSPQPHDYTAPIGKGIDDARWDEGTAQLAGWNAI